MIDLLYSRRRNSWKISIISEALGFPDAGMLGKTVPSPYKKVV